MWCKCHRQNNTGIAEGHLPSLPEDGAVPPGMGSRWTGILIDLLIAVVLFSVAMAFAMTYYKVWPGRARFYEQYDASSVMLALGLGYKDTSNPVVLKFLEKKTSAIQPHLLINDVKAKNPSRWQRWYRYPLYILGALWYVFGIHWDAILPFYGVLFGASIALAYLLFRLLMNRALSILCALGLMTSPGLLTILPYLRDFNKAPFIYAVLFGIAYVVKHSLSWWRLWLVAALIGVTIGIGISFRVDVLILTPIAVLALLFFTPGNFLRQIPKRLAAAVLLVVALYGSAYPIFSRLGEEPANGFHVLNMGFATPYLANLGLGQAPYEVGYIGNSDWYTHTTITAYAMATHGEQDEVKFASPRYDTLSRDYFIDVNLRFPADFVTRWLYAVKYILDYSAFTPDTFEVRATPLTMINNLVELRWRLFGWLSGHGLWLALIGIALLSTHSVRYGLMASILLLYTAGYGSLQFHLRHVFHLEIFFWCLLGWIVQELLAGLRRACMVTRWGGMLGRFRASPARVLAPMGRVRTVLAVSLVMALLPLFLARGLQDSSVLDLLSKYDGAVRTPIAYTAEGDDMVLLKPVDFLNPKALTAIEKKTLVQPGLLMAEALPTEVSWSLRLVYEAPNWESDFSHTFLVPPRSKVGPDPVRFYFPIYNSPPTYRNGGRQFAGLQVAAPNAPKVLGLYKVDAAAVPLLFNICLPGNWRSEPRWLSQEAGFAPDNVKHLRARAENLLANGSFEEWADDVAVPLDAMLSQSSSERSLRELFAAAHGHFALRQLWSGSCSFEDYLKRFYVYTPNVRPGGHYTLWLKAMNLSRRTFAIAAILAYEDAQGERKFRVIHPAAVRVPPEMTYRRFKGKFAVPDIDAKRWTLILAPLSIDEEQVPADIIWDDWCLVENPN